MGIIAPRQQVYQALATTEGLSRWWTRDTAGDPAVGGKLEFYFGQAEPGGVMEVTELDAGQRVAWRCMQGPDEWVGTVITVDLSRAGHEPGGQTVLLFTRAGWREPAEFIYRCSTKWAYFLLGLKAGAGGWLGHALSAGHGHQRLGLNGEWMTYSGPCPTRAGGACSTA